MTDLRVIGGGKKKPLTRKEARELVGRYMAMNKAELIEAAKDEDAPAYEQLVVRTVIKAIQANDFAAIDHLADQVVSAFGAVEDDDPLPNVTDDAATKALDLDRLRDDLAKGIYVSARMMAQQAVFEHARIEAMRATLQVMEGRLLNPDTVRRMTDGQVMKLYGIVAENLGISMDFIKGFNTTVTTSIEALTHVQTLKAVAAAATGDARYDAAVNQVRALIQQSIKAKLAQEAQAGK